MLETAPRKDASILRRERYTKEQLKWLDLATNFADQIPLEDVIASDRDNQFRRDLFERACQEGLGSIPFPEDYGGQGGGDI